ncbi:MAG: hypothetical protein ACI37S_00020 [Candidatus Gastranaerophilaceae bacterium]
MKNFLLIVIILFALGQITYAQDNVVLNGNITFDWCEKSQFERDESINKIKNIIYSEDIVKKYNKKTFRLQYKDYLKDKQYKEHYIAVSNGKKENKTERMSGFYTKNGKILIAYGIQYKNDMQTVYYYDTFGNLKYVDKYSENYPNFPYYTHQYRLDGKLVASIYFTQYDTQYLFKNGKFEGVWFKNTMFNAKAKKIMNRTNY